MNKYFLTFSCEAENGTRTRDPQLGKLMLYQLSYFRTRVVFIISTLFEIVKVG